ncbi:hypothetical protein [Sphingomonas montana]|uniref:hypothetical protein n=1 Tax=Sphingomonas montana TaxID=1843236 RepID=UPI00096F2ECD|nr:hypothetical protein [Sphingomonas montana]
MTSNTFTSATHLVGKVAGQITSSGKVPGLGPKGAVWIDKGQQPNGSWLYWRKGYAPPSPTAIPTPIPSPTARIDYIGAEAFMQSDRLAVGLNASGTLGTRASAPAGIITDRDSGFLRVGMVAIGAKGEDIAGDAMLKGTPVEAFVVAYQVGAKIVRVVNAERLGPSQMTGEILPEPDRVTWVGDTADLHILQTMTLAGGVLTIDVAIVNASTKTLTDLRYMRLIDPDHDANPDAFKTTNAIVAPAAVSATASGVTLTLSSDDPRARASIQPFGPPLMLDPYKASAWDVPQPVAPGRKADDLLHLTFALGSLASGATARLTLRYEIAVA